MLLVTFWDTVFFGSDMETKSKLSNIKLKLLAIAQIQVQVQVQAITDPFIVQVRMIV